MTPLLSGTDITQQSSGAVSSLFNKTSDGLTGSTVTSQGIQDTVHDITNNANGHSGYEKQNDALPLTNASGQYLSGSVISDPAHYSGSDFVDKNGTHWSLSGTSGSPVIYVSTSDKGNLDYQNSLNARGVRNGNLVQTGVTSYIHDHGGNTGLCSQQLDPVANGLNIAGVGTDLAGAILESITSPAAEFGVEVAADVVEAAGIGVELGGAIVGELQSQMPNCEAEFTGTVQADSNVYAGQGIQAFNDAITIGSKDGTTYQDGISLGGGMLQGAGTGQGSTADDANAIAIGNGAHAGAGDTAIGTNATATGTQSTAIGNTATATGDSSTAVGDNSTASGNFSLDSASANNIKLGEFFECFGYGGFATANIARHYNNILHNQCAFYIQVNEGDFSIKV